MASRNVDKLKSVQRIHEAMKMWAVYICPLALRLIYSPYSTVNLLTFEKIRADKATLLISFLAHPFPKVSMHSLLDKNFHLIWGNC